MPRPRRIEYENAYYHVMNRGRDRQNIFRNEEYYDDILLSVSDSPPTLQPLGIVLLPNE